jgi:hypothetical protein
MKQFQVMTATETQMQKEWLPSNTYNLILWYKVNPTKIEKTSNISEDQSE